MDRHAYLIMAHHQWELLKILIYLIDDERNDIYIHVSRKIKNAPFEEIKQYAKCSRVFIVERVNVNRGTYSSFEAEMALLKTAYNREKYAYFHLLSGQDLPLKNQDYIHNFFEVNNGKNFVDLMPIGIKCKDWYERYSLYQILSAQALDKNVVKSILAKGIRKIAICAQRLLKVDRIMEYKKNGLELCYGSNWFSITREFALYILDKEELIQKLYKRLTFAPEESIIQTFLWSSPFKSTLFEPEYIDHKLNRSNLRLIIWTGNTSPEIISMKYADLLKHTPNLFARKFDIIHDVEAVKYVKEMISKEEYEDYIRNI